MPRFGGECGLIQKLTSQEALPFFNNPSQRRANGLIDGEDLGDWLLYRALGGVCLSFHQHLWPGVWMVHLGAKPEAWGNLDGDTAALVRAFADEVDASRIIAWVREENRAVLSLCRRIGFEIDGRLPARDVAVMVGWSR